MPPPKRKRVIHSVSVVGAPEPKRAVVPAKEVKNEQPAGEVYSVDPGDTVFSDEPSVADQYVNENFRGSWMEGPLTYKQFNMAIPADALEMNKLLTQVEPPGAPRVLLVEDTKTYCSRAKAYMILLGFRRITYKRLIKQPEHSPSEADLAAQREIDEKSSNKPTP